MLHTQQTSTRRLIYSVKQLRGNNQIVTLDENVCMTSKKDVSKRSTSLQPDDSDVFVLGYN